MAKKNENETTETEAAEGAQDQASTTSATSAPTTKSTGGVGVRASTSNHDEDSGNSGSEPKRAVLAKVPYPHHRLTLPEGIRAGDGAHVDLVITREWTEVPADQVQRLKDTARRGKIKLALAVPETDENGG